MFWRVYSEKLLSTMLPNTIRANVELYHYIGFSYHITYLGIDANKAIAAMPIIK
jgi:hypothetical protein